MPGTWLTTSNTTDVMSTSVSGIPLPDTAGDLAQTFYLDPLSVLNSRYAFLTSIDLYFYEKPNHNGVVSTSGIPKPGVTVTICDTKLLNSIQVPDLDKPIKYSQVRKEWDDITTDTTGATATTFTFPRVPLETDYTYAIIVKFDGFDKGYSLWRNKAGETYNNVVSPSISKGALDGYFFVLTNGTNLTTQADTDLKFAVKVAKFQTTPVTYSIVNRDIEKLKYNGSTLTGQFIGGEPVYANTGVVSSQTVSITASSNTVTGTNTLFTSSFSTNNYIVIKSGTNSFVRRITNISNNTLMKVSPTLPITHANANYLIAPVGIVYDHFPYGNTLTIAASSANTTVNFLPNSSCNTVFGSISGAKVTILSYANTRIDEFAQNFQIFEPPGTSTNTMVKLANSTYNTVNTLYPVAQTTSGTKKRFNAFPAYLYSRTGEVTLGNGSFGTLTNTKSVNFQVTFNTDNPFASPFLDEEDLKLYVYSRYVNNDLSNEYKGNGSAVSKYVSRTVTLAEGHDSEDMIVFVDAFRPFTTDIVVYAKFYNPSDQEAFKDKNWTRLELLTPASTYSNPNNLLDLVELKYQLPKYPIYDWNTRAAGNNVTGTFTGTNGSANLVTASLLANVGSNGAFAGDLVRVFNPLFPNNSLITVVTFSNNTTLSLATTLSTSNTRLAEFCTTGLTVQKVNLKNVAFSNYTANGIIRYYNSSLSAFDTYKSFALKVVLTGTSGSGVYPYVKDIRGIAVSI